MRIGHGRVPTADQHESLTAQQAALSLAGWLRTPPMSPPVSDRRL